MKWLTKLLAPLVCLFAALPAFADLQYIVGEAGQITIVGLSTDVKPSTANGSVFFEADTDKVYIRTAGNWVEQTNASYLATDIFPQNAEELALSISPVNI